MSQQAISLNGIHHVAYRCNDAEETVNWYAKYLDMEFVLAIAEDKVPSTGEPDPYMHVFLAAGTGNVLAFFELPTKQKMSRDANTPAWVQHIAFKLNSMTELESAKARLESDNYPVLGPIDHRLFKSIYFYDPNGHRIELAVDTADKKMMERVCSVKWAMLKEWSQTRKAPQHASWLHEQPSDESSEQ